MSVTTLDIGEESEINMLAAPTTMRTGEEDDPPHTTMATGEEESAVGSSDGDILNPFGAF